ncbi:MAG: hypothetical protein ACRDOK_24590 [Streptosporangiaceae bacterium]
MRLRRDPLCPEHRAAVAAQLEALLPPDDCCAPGPPLTCAAAAPVLNPDVVALTGVV